MYWTKLRSMSNRFSIAYLSRHAAAEVDEWGGEGGHHKPLTNHQQMRKLLLLTLAVTALVPFSFGQQKWYDKAGHGLRIFFSGFSGPVYRTDAVMLVHRPGKPDDEIHLAAGLRYRLLDEKDGEVYLQPLPFVKEVADTIRMKDDSAGIALGREAFIARATDLKDYHRAWQQGLAWSNLLLPLKIRQAVTKDTVEYGRDITTDIAIGPFFGYKFAMGRSYRQFMHVGGFAGPSLLRLTSATADSTSNAVEVESSNNMGLSYGLGVIYEMRGMQMGLIWGKDEIGGTAAKEWAYNRKPWLSFAIGYNFLSNQR